MESFEWDEDKNRSNKVKHGVNFEAILGVFNDPFAIAEHQFAEGEDRFQIIGW